MFISIFAALAALFNVHAGVNKATINAFGLEVEVADEADAATLFQALANAEEYIGDGAVERTLKARSIGDLLYVRCAGNHEHYCKISYANKAAAYPRNQAKPYYTSFALSPEINEVFAKTLDLPSRAAGHTAIKEYKTRDGLSRLGCSHHRNESPRCWLEVDLNRATLQ